MEKEQIKSIIEALFFISDKPIFVHEIKNVIEDIEPHQVREIVSELSKDYEESKRSLKIIEIAGGFQMVTDPVFAPWLKKFYKASGTERLSGPSLETLAIIAYKQPVTKPEIEAIRGVNVDGVLKTLVEKNLVRIIGRRETVGRPIIYGITQEFLQYFGLNSVDELPKLEDFHFTEKDIELPEHLKKEDDGLVQAENPGPSLQMNNEEEAKDDAQKPS